LRRVDMSKISENKKSPLHKDPINEKKLFLDPSELKIKFRFFLVWVRLVVTLVESFILYLDKTFVNFRQKKILYRKFYTLSYQDIRLGYKKTFITSATYDIVTRMKQLTTYNAVEVNWFLKRVYVDFLFGYVVPNLRHFKK
jgi:hypothetical protein